MFSKLFGSLKYIYVPYFKTMRKVLLELWSFFKFLLWISLGKEQNFIFSEKTTDGSTVIIFLVNVYDNNTYPCQIS